MEADTSMVFLWPVCARWLLPSSDLTPWTFNTAAGEVTKPLNHKTKCIVTEQGGWKVTAHSDHVIRKAFRRGYINPLFCTTWSPFKNVSVHPWKLENLQPQVFPWTEGLHTEFFCLCAGLLHGLQRWRGGTVKERRVAVPWFWEVLHCIFSLQS